MIIIIMILLQGFDETLLNQILLPFENIRSRRKFTTLNFRMGQLHNQAKLTILFGFNKRHRHTGAASTARTSDAMNVRLVILRNIVVDDMGNIIDVNTTCCHISSNQHIDASFTELLHHTIPLNLRQVTMQSTSRIAPCIEGSCQIIDSALRAAEDNEFACLFHIKHPAKPIKFLTSLIIYLIDQRNRQIFTGNRHLLRIFHITT